MNVVIAAGGTGGHMYPAVALAEEFGRQDPLTSITLVGTGRALEHTMLANKGFQLEKIHVQGAVGRGLWSWVKAVFLIPGAIVRAIRMLRVRCADLVIGTGGYTSPPVVIAAFLLGIRRALLEPNAVPGLANRLLGPMANRVFLSFEAAQQYFNPSRARVVGAPIRRAFFYPEPTPSAGQIHSLLLCGGSQGARALNSAMIEAVKGSGVIQHNLKVIHQTGPNDYDRVKAAYRGVTTDVEVFPFIEDMPSMLRAVDLVISRCGALTLSELAACGKPAILVPFPYATHGHQEKNARAVEEAGAGIVLLQTEATGFRLAQEIETLMKNPEQVRHMALQSFSLRKTDSAARMVQECCELVMEKRSVSNG